MRLMPVSPPLSLSSRSEELVQVLQVSPSLTPAAVSPWLAWGHVLSLLPYSHESLTSPIPLTPAVPPANGTSVHGSKPPHKGCLFPTATTASCAHTPWAAADLWGSAEGLWPRVLPQA